jgi:hypothetical protein
MLSEDVFIEMLSFLDVHTILHEVALVNHSWYSLIVNSEHLWRTVYNSLTLSTIKLFPSSDESYLQQVLKLYSIRFIKNPREENELSRFIIEDGSNWRTATTNIKVPLNGNAGVVLCWQIIVHGIVSDQKNHYGLIPGVSYDTSYPVTESDDDFIVGSDTFGVGFGINNCGFHIDDKYYASEYGEGEYTALDTKYLTRPDDSIFIQIKILEDNKFNLEFYLSHKVSGNVPVLMKPRQHVKNATRTKTDSEDRVRNAINNISAEWVMPCVSFIHNSHFEIRCVPPIRL